eukprot:COSAG05_NODE_631_length_8203_cov_23.575148_2_plen_164_part_00
MCRTESASLGKEKVKEKEEEEEEEEEEVKEEEQQVKEEKEEEGGGGNGDSCTFIECSICFSASFQKNTGRCRTALQSTIAPIGMYLTQSVAYIHPYPCRHTSSPSHSISLSQYPSLSLSLSLSLSQCRPSQAQKTSESYRIGDNPIYVNIQCRNNNNTSKHAR